MKKTKRIVRVRYGYRLKPAARQTRKIKAKKSTEAAVQAVELSSSASDNEAQAVLRTVVPSAQTSGCAAESQVAEFSKEFNPYKAYLNDMRQSLSDIPSESFVVETQSAALVNAQDRVADNSDSVSVTEPLAACLTAESATSEQPSASQQALATTSAENSQADDASVDAQTSTHGDSSDDADVLTSDSELHCQSQTKMPLAQPLDRAKQSTCITHSEQPDNAWLSGVKSCLLAGKSRI